MNVPSPNREDGKKASSAVLRNYAFDKPIVTPLTSSGPWTWFFWRLHASPRVVATAVGGATFLSCETPLLAPRLRQPLCQTISCGQTRRSLPQAPRFAGALADRYGVAQTGRALLPTSVSILSEVLERQGADDEKPQRLGVCIAFNLGVRGSQHPIPDRRPPTVVGLPSSEQGYV